MKRFLSLLLMFSLGLCLSSPAFGAEAGGFSDVQPEDWFAPYVEVCVEAGLMNGTGEGLFAPERELTDAECILLALRLRRASQELPLQLPAIPEGWGTLSLTAEDGTPLFSYLDLQGSTTNAQDLLTLWLPQEAAKPLAGQRGQLVIHGDVVLEGCFTVYEEDGFAQRAGFQIDAPHDPEKDDPMAPRYNPVSDLIWDAAQWAFALSQAPEWLRDGIYEMAQADLSFIYLGYGSQPTTRRAFLDALEAVLPPEALLPERNEIQTLPDVPFYTQGGETYTDDGVADFYRAGILSGVDQYGSFHGEGYLTRAEAAALLARILKPELRLTFTLEEKPWEGPDYTLTPLEVSFEDWWDGCPVTCWHFPMDAEDVSEYQLLHLCKRTGPSVKYDQLLVMDVQGNVLVQPGQYLSVHSFHSNGLASVTAESLYYADAKYGVIDRTGKEILPSKYRALGISGDGVIAAQEAEGEEFTLFDEQGQVIGSLPAWTAPGWGIREGRCPFYLEEEKLWGYTDLEGNIVIPAQYEHVGSFHEGLAAVALEGKAGFIDSQGEVVIPLELDSWVEGSYLYSGTEAYHFEQGVATVRQDGEWFLMDHAGTQVSPRRYDELSRWFTLGTVQYQDWDGPQGSGFLTPQGEERPIPALTDVNIMADCGACYLAQWPMLWAHTYLDREGKPLLPQWFLQAAPLVNGTALVQDFDGVYYRLELEL